MENTWNTLHLKSVSCELFRAITSINILAYLFILMRWFVKFKTQISSWKVEVTVTGQRFNIFMLDFVRTIILHALKDFNFYPNTCHFPGYIPSWYFMTSYDTIPFFWDFASAVWLTNGQCYIVYNIVASYGPFFVVHNLIKLDMPLMKGKKKEKKGTLILIKYFFFIFHDMEKFLFFIR